LGHVRIRHLPISAIRPSPENIKLYRPVIPTDPEIIRLADSIRDNGVLEPIIVTLDNYIVSGHRRHCAAQLAGRATIPCRKIPVTRSEDPDRFLVLLREHNRQREKSFDEKLREELVSTDPGEAYHRLIEYRAQRSRVSVAPLDIGAARPRGRTAKNKCMNTLATSVGRVKPDVLPRLSNRMEAKP